jgi:hypothetical protein
MPLPDYSPRSDSFGNWYYGGFQKDSQAESGYGANHTIGPSEDSFQTFLNAALGSNWIKSGSYYYIIFSNPYEERTVPVSTTNYRFNLYSTSISMNTQPVSDTATTFGVSSLNISTFFSATSISFAVANQYGMWLCYSNKGTVAGTLGTSISSTYFGWVKDPVFPINTSDRYRNLVAGTFTAGTNSELVAAPGTTSFNYAVLNSAITCSVATPGANVSDMCVLDASNNYLNIGSLYNSLFYPGTGLTVGQIYRIPPASDPDGNTEQNIWLCAGQVYGWNGSAGTTNAGYKLIRVWSNNIT